MASLQNVSAKTNLVSLSLHCLSLSTRKSPEFSNDSLLRKEEEREGGERERERRALDIEDGSTQKWMDTIAQPRRVGLPRPTDASHRRWIDIIGGGREEEEEEEEEVESGRGRGRKREQHLRRPVFLPFSVDRQGGKKAAYDPTIHL